MNGWEDDPWKVQFLGRIDVREDGCWIWQGQQGKYYGRWYAGDTEERWAHRIAYRLHHGEPVPHGLTVDHLCRVTMCVNPLHMEAVTLEENLRRAAEARAAETVERHDLVGFWRGCRCRSCSKANVAYVVERRAERRRQFAAGDLEIEHGTNYGYSYFLCRCDDCSTAGLAEAERQRRKRGVKARPVAQHGGTTMYTKHKCRCDECRAGWAQYWREHRAKRREAVSA